MRAVTIIEAIQDRRLFRAFLKDSNTWRAWIVFLKALFALPMKDEELAIYRQHTGRTAAPTVPFFEAWLVVGRRGGKSFIVALVAVFLACFRDYSAHLAPGERGVVMVTAADRKQARVIFRYVRALLTHVPMLAQMIERTTVDTIDLNNDISIEIHTASFRSTRGYTIVAAINDEIAIWRSEESASPDVEVLAAQRPGMATIPGAMLLCLSSPYARRGAMWEAYRDHHGKDSPVLVWQADTRTMNPTVPQRIIDDAYARDPASAAAEYGAQFRSDVAAFLNSDWLDATTEEGVHERPFQPFTPYVAFADPSGGGADAFTLAIAHHDAATRQVVLDVLRARHPPFSPESVVEDYAKLLKSYGLHSVTGDKYAAQWVVEAFGRHAIGYMHSERSKSELYLEAEPLFAQGRVRLLDDRALLTELRQLERRTGRGRDSVDHPPRGHDDRANAACGALVLAARRTGAGCAIVGPDITLAVDAQDAAQPEVIGRFDL